MATTPRYPKVSTQNLVRSPGFDFDVPSPLSQAVSRRLVEQQAAEAKQADMNASPLDKAVSALKATASMGSMMFEALQQLPKLSQGEDAYTQAIGKRAYLPEDPRALEYMGNAGDLLDRLQTEYKLPPILPEVAGFQPLGDLAKTQAMRSMENLPVGMSIKPKGGNWLKGSVESVVNPLKQQYPEIAAPGVGLTEDVIRARHPNVGAINDWVDRNLTNYIKKEMATPEDPVRKLAEEGIVHMPPEQMGYGSSQAEGVRNKFGTPRLGQSPEAQAWEDATDVSMYPIKIKDFPNMAHRPNVKMEPWMEKADPETQVFMPLDNMHANYLGFDHIIDVLKQDLAEGRIRPEQLSKVSMEQAVRRAHEYDQEMAKRMAETQAKVTEGMPVHKEYPEGYKWIELTKPEKLPEGWSLDSHGNAIGLEGNYAQHPGEKALEDALKYEGDTMGHCVGGYCPDVLEGRSRIFSLRDKKGEPHVTIEVKPNQHLDFNTWWDKQPKELRDEINARARRGEHNGSVYEAPEYLSARNALPPAIKQIKGKGNAKPKEDYIPYVQDFVRGGDWSDVGDIQNTGLYKIDKDFLGATSAYMPEAEDIKHLKRPQREEALLKGIESGDLPETGYVTRPEWEEVIRKHGRPTQGEVTDDLLRQLQPPEEGMKAGGKVHVSDNPDSMMMDVEDQKFQVGGIVDAAARAAKAAKAAQLKQAMKASEALAKIEGKRLNITQADRTKVGQGYLGGPGFSGLQLQEGPHKDVGAVWGVKNVGTAKTMLSGFQDPLGKEYFTTMIGSPIQHQSNQMVFDKLYNDFKREAKKGNLDPELKDKINARLAAAVDKNGNPVFPDDVDILDKNFKKIANTFDRRAIAGNLMGGTGVGGKKGQIIDYDKIIRDTTDPYLLDAPSGSLGYRLWTPSGEIIERPDLHPAFPAIATGEDLGVEFTPAAQDILMAPWMENVRQTKGRNPGYMDWTRGRPASVEVTEDILTNLQKSGNKAGGLIKVKHKAGGGMISKVAKEALERMKPARAEMAARGALWDKKMAEDASKYTRDIDPFSPSMEDIQAEIQRMQSKQDVQKAIGGAINADDLILTERPL